jgi:hypothetical protein
MARLNKEEAEAIGLTKPGEWAGAWGQAFALVPTKTQDGWVWLRRYWRRQRGPMYWDSHIWWYEKRLNRPKTREGET